MSENYFTFEELKQRLKPAQRLAAELIVANDFAGKEDKKNLDEIGKEVGVDRRTLYNWRQNADFTRYLAAISDNKLDQYRSLADSQLMKLVMGTSNNGLPSVKGLEMYYKLVGRMQDRQTLIVEENRRLAMTRDEISEQLKELDKYVN